MSTSTSATVHEIETCLHEILDGWAIATMLVCSSPAGEENEEDEENEEWLDHTRRVAEAVVKVAFAKRRLQTLVESGIPESIVPPPGYTLRPWFAQLVSDAEKVCQYAGMLRVFPDAFEKGQAAFDGLADGARYLRNLRNLAAVPEPSDVKPAKQEPVATWLSSSDLARRHGLVEKRDALDKRLNRWRFENGNGWLEIPDSDRRPREPKFLYDPTAVAEIIDAMKGKK